VPFHRAAAGSRPVSSVRVAMPAVLKWRRHQHRCTGMRPTVKGVPFITEMTRSLAGNGSVGEAESHAGQRHLRPGATEAGRALGRNG
jgi:hypothetical protein